MVQFHGLRFIPGLATILENDFGGGYQANVFFRNPNGTPLVGTDAGTEFPQVELVDDLGLKQGLLWNPELGRNLLEAFAFYRLHFDYNLTGGGTPLIFDSSFPDRVEILSNSILLGADYDTTVQDKVHKTWDGLYAEATGEWGPGFLFNSIGNANYYRLNLTAHGFRTLYTSSQPNGRNLFSVYAGDFFAADYAGGSSIPIYIQQTIGGRYPRYGVADAVRGFEPGAYDTQLKVVNNLELRVTGPAVIWPSFLPGAYVFFDTGYYDGYFGDPGNTPGGMIGSVGIGLFADLLDLANATVYLGFPVIGRRVDGSPYAIEAHFSLQF